MDFEVAVQGLTACRATSRVAIYVKRVHTIVSSKLLLENITVVVYKYSEQAFICSSLGFSTTLLLVIECSLLLNIFKFVIPPGQDLVIKEDSQVMAHVTFGD